MMSVDTADRVLATPFAAPPRRLASPAALTAPPAPPAAPPAAPAALTAPPAPPAAPPAAPAALTAPPAPPAALTAPPAPPAAPPAAPAALTAPPAPPAALTAPPAPPAAPPAAPAALTAPPAPPAAPPAAPAALTAPPAAPAAPAAPPAAPAAALAPSASPATSCPPNLAGAAGTPLIRWVTGEPARRLLQDFSGERTGYVRVSEKGYFLPSKFATELEHFMAFRPRPTDTWIVTYPRSGTTWTQEMTWLLANDLDFEAARRTSLNERFPFFEFSAFFHEDTKREFLEKNAGRPDLQQAVLDMSAPGYEVLARAEGPRFIKTHLPFSLLPKDLLSCGAKVIYLARNPKDVAVSFFHLNRLILTQGYSGDFKTYWNYFQNDLHAWTPYWAHLEEGWQRRTHPRVLFMFYEDMRRDTEAAIRKVAHFLGKQPTSEQVARLADHLDIANFRNNPAVNSEALYELGIMRQEEQAFIRNGKVGGWGDYFTPELEVQADQWIQENLSKTDMRFPNYVTNGR